VYQTTRHLIPEDSNLRHNQLSTGTTLPLPEYQGTEHLCCMSMKPSCSTQLSHYSDYLQSVRPENQVRFPAEARGFSVLHSVQNGFGPHTTSSRYSGSFLRGMKLTTHLRKVQRLRMRGATSPLPPTPFD
jgi:hypothetical protein